MRMPLMGFALAALLLAGCGTTYSWRPGVPEGFRTVAVPTFRSETDLTEFGSVMTRQVLRELQREGTFRIRPSGESALEIQGTVKSVSTPALAYTRRSGLRMSAYEATASVAVSVIDKRAGKVLVDNRIYEGRTTFTASQDLDTARRDMSGRLADDVARQIVDDLLNMKW